MTSDIFKASKSHHNQESEKKIIVFGSFFQRNFSFRYLCLPFSSLKITFFDLLYYCTFSLFRFLLLLRSFSLRLRSFLLLRCFRSLLKLLRLRSTSESSSSARSSAASNLLISGILENAF